MVVDASVAGSCGSPTASCLVSLACRSALITILNQRFKAVMSPALAAEWDEHQSRFARHWRVQMTKKRLIYRVPGQTHRKLANSIAAMQLSEREKRVAQKDFHLIAAAALTDRIVLSRDEEARGVFRAVARVLEDLQNILWVNPAIPEELCETWLREGANFDQTRCM
jgi:hypothetical protein